MEHETELKDETFVRKSHQNTFAEVDFSRTVFLKADGKDFLEDFSWKEEVINEK